MNRKYVSALISPSARPEPMLGTVKANGENRQSSRSSRPSAAATEPDCIREMIREVTHHSSAASPPSTESTTTSPTTTSPRGWPPEQPPTTPPAAIRENTMR